MFDNVLTHKKCVAFIRRNNNLLFFRSSRCTKKSCNLLKITKYNTFIESLPTKVEVVLVCVLFSISLAVRYHLACTQCPCHHPSHPKLVVSYLCYLRIRQMKFIKLLNLLDVCCYNQYTVLNY